MEEKAFFVFHWMKHKDSFDIEVPLEITANELILALNMGLGLGIDAGDISQLYLKATNPIALLKGNKTLEDFGLHNGSEIWFER